MQGATHTPVGVTDGDGDGLTNAQEAAVFTALGGTSYQANSCPDIATADTDGDGISDGDEINSGGLSDKTYTAVAIRGSTDGTGPNNGAFPDSNPCNADTDGDGLDDGQEEALGTDATDTDTDNDGETDGDEVADGTDPLDDDNDNDGLSNQTEMLLGTDPNKKDTDDDGIDENEVVNNDANATDYAATTSSGGDTDPLNDDTDGDGLLDGDEVNAGASFFGYDDASCGASNCTYASNLPVPDMDSNPNMADSDSDGLDDAAERTAGTSPQDDDSDGDTLKDGFEVNTFSSDPLDQDSDNGGLPDGANAGTANEFDNGHNPNDPFDD